MTSAPPPPAPEDAPRGARAVVRHVLRLDRLPRNRPHPVRLVPDAGQLEALADRLDLSALRKARLEGALRPVEGGWALSARLGATVVQPCRVTTDPVTTRIEVEIDRSWIDGWVPSDEGEDELTDGVEALPASLDLGAVLEEELDLALPAFPRAERAEEIDLTAAPAGAAPLEDEARRPFAGLAALRDRMGGEDEAS